MTTNLQQPNARSASTRVARGSRMACSVLLSLVVVAALLAAGGCNRAFYRQQADDDAYELIREKADHPHWPLQRYTTDIHPFSRMFNPFPPDRPPMPADDPTSHQFMHLVDGKAGYRRWHENGDTQVVENPLWMAHLPMNEDGILELDVKTAVKLSLIHSRDYQSQLEELYLSALDVSTERFVYDIQHFGGVSSFFAADGPDRRGAGGQSSSSLTTGSFNRGRRVSNGLGASARGFSTGGGGFTAQRAFTTGADLVVGLANALVWQFSGANTQVATTTLDFAIVQPLLRGAGRDRVLETLTIAERALLANVRQMERYRRGFFLTVVTGRNAERGPQRRGGFFGAAGLGGFTGVGGGGFGNVGNVGFGGGGGGGVGAVQAGGYFGLLQTEQDIRNQQANIAGLRSNLVTLTETLKESLQKPTPDDQILRQRLQVAQARQALINAQSRLLSTHNGQQAAIDDFKVRRLGLPPTVCVKIEEHADEHHLSFQQFNLIDTEIIPRQNGITNIRDEVGQINDILLQAIEYEIVDDLARPKPIPWSAELAAHLQKLRELVARTSDIRQQLETVNVQRARDDIKRLIAQIDGRKEDVKRLREEYAEMLDNPDRVPREVYCQLKLLVDLHPDIFDTKRLDDLPLQLEDALRRLELRFQSYALPPSHFIDWFVDTSRIEDLVGKDGLVDLRRFLDRLLAKQEELAAADVDELQRRLIFGVPGILSLMSADVLDLSLLQAEARAQSIRLVPVDLRPDHALEIARCYRRDWMNARAGLVDSWRLVQFNANDLESSLDIVFSGDIQNRGDHPFELKDSTGRLRVGLQFDAPFTRLQERNTYRQSLIEYEQAKRAYYTFVDQVSQGLRGTIRQMNLNEVNFEQQRLAVLGAIRQIVLNDEIQKLSDQRGQTSGATAARDAVSALADLQDAQNSFLGFWLNYEVLRRGLDLDLGTMQLDYEGIWIDPGAIGPEYGYPGGDDCPSCTPELLGVPLEYAVPLPSEALEHLEPPEPLLLPSDDDAGGERDDADLGLPPSTSLQPNRFPVGRPPRVDDQSARESGNTVRMAEPRSRRATPR